LRIISALGQVEGARRRVATYLQPQDDPCIAQVLHFEKNSKHLEVVDCQQVLCYEKKIVNVHHDDDDIAGIHLEIEACIRVDAVEPV